MLVEVRPSRDLRIVAGGMVAAAAVWPLLPLHPPLACPLRAATGIPCPACGMTRAVVAAVHGDFVDSLRYNPLGIAVLLFAILLLVRPSAARLRAPMWATLVVVGALWSYNIALNPTFT